MSYSAILNDLAPLVNKKLLPFSGPLRLESHFRQKEEPEKHPALPRFFFSGTD
jgi:hypothetical protein